MSMMMVLMMWQLLHHGQVREDAIEPGAHLFGRDASEQTQHVEGIFVVLSRRAFALIELDQLRDQQSRRTGDPS